MTIQTFFKAKNNILQTLNINQKSKINPYKEYEVKIKMVQEQWLQLKMKFLLGYNMKTVIFEKLGFTPCKAEQPLLGMELQEKEAPKY